MPVASSCLFHHRTLEGNVLFPFCRIIDDSTTVLGRIARRHVAWSVSVCMSVCVLVTRVCCAKTAETIEMPFGGSGLTLVGPRNSVLDGTQDRTNPFAAPRGDTTQCGLCQISLDTCLFFVSTLIGLLVICRMLIGFCRVHDTGRTWQHVRGVNNRWRLSAQRRALLR